MKKNILIALFFIIAAPIVIGLCLKYSSIPFMLGSGDAWLGYWSSFLGSAFGVFGAYWVMKEQVKIEKESVIVPGISENEEVLIEPLKDLHKNKREFKDLNKYSDLSIPIYNGGSSPVFNLFYYQEIINIEEIKSYLENATTVSNIEAKIFYLYGQNDFEKGCILKYLHQSGGIDLALKNVIKQINYIKPGEVDNIYLNAVTMGLWNYYFLNLPFSEDMPMPITRIHVRYKDYQMHDKNFSFDITEPTYIHRNNGDEMNIKLTIQTSNLKY